MDPTRKKITSAFVLQEYMRISIKCFELQLEQCLLEQY